MLEATGGVVPAPTAPDLTSGVHLLIALVTRDDGAALVHLFVGPILAPHRPTATARTDEPKAVMGRNAKQNLEIEPHQRVNVRARQSFGAVMLILCAACARLLCMTAQSMAAIMDGAQAITSERASETCVLDG